MPSNPQVPLGTLNKLRGSVSLVDHPELNVTAPFLTDDGIGLGFEGNASAYLPVMTGGVPSPNPYQMATVTVHLLKTNGLAQLWKDQQEVATTIGDVVVTPDTSALNPYTLVNCTIQGVRELDLSGRTPAWVVMVQGTYYINSQLFDLQ